jgi:NADPH-dependent 2,4-dienoyl-CoA reductase/sulfur reductase-like enzyme/nitrite reductase/ring-hydroxylating ferredoxin subunit
MSEARTEPEGPDLEKGVPGAEIVEGKPLAGHFRGEAVLLARVGDEVCAVGATCTHYGGPLAEGLQEGATVHCPWHHACFDLRSGEAVGPPALSPLPRWRVEREGERGVVKGRLEEAPPTRRPDSGAVPESVVIVGAGAAGNAAAEMLRRLGYGGRVVMIGAEAELPYDRPNLSKDYLSGNAPEEWIPLRSREFYEEREIELKLGAPVRELDAAGRRVVLEDGEEIAFGGLLLATGAEPVRLKIPGAELPHVHYLRTLAQSRAIVAAAEGAGRAVVLGASFIGLEVAASLRARGLEVHDVAPDEVPLERVMGREVGGFVRTLHEEHGVVFHLGRTARSITAGAVELSTGERLPAELVVLGIGVRPLTGLAERAGLGVEDGVLVDEYLETSEPGIYAAGDIARWHDARSGEHRRVEHWVVAEAQGQAAARNLLGERLPFRAVPFFWSQHYDTALSYVGHVRSWEDTLVDGTPASGDFAVGYRAGGEIRAVLTSGRDRESLRAELALATDDQDRLRAILMATTDDGRAS